MAGKIQITHINGVPITRPTHTCTADILVEGTNADYPNLTVGGLVNIVPPPPAFGFSRPPYPGSVHQGSNWDMRFYGLPLSADLTAGSKIILLVEANEDADEYDFVELNVVSTVAHGIVTAVAQGDCDLPPIGIALPLPSSIAPCFTRQHRFVAWGFILSEHQVSGRVICKADNSSVHGQPLNSGLIWEMRFENTKEGLATLRMRDALNPAIRTEIEIDIRDFPF